MQQTSSAVLATKHLYYAHHVNAAVACIVANGLRVGPSPLGQIHSVLVPGHIGPVPISSQQQAENDEVILGLLKFKEENQIDLLHVDGVKKFTEKYIDGVRQVFDRLDAPASSMSFSSDFDDDDGDTEFHPTLGNYDLVAMILMELNYTPIPEFEGGYQKIQNWVNSYGCV